ncbi:hypothetical protein BGZ57DRAFT_369000 [Hyaloscypha finlandica]|nr:hypothetical protein BGZ57DRAFT_369000 [Hyaloscypha finlandica]
MVLDPFTAIGLAGNIVQFVDYSSKLISSTYEIYRSSTGSSKNHVYLEAIATRLLELNRTLEQPKLTGTKSYDKALLELRAECSQDAEDLLRLIEALRAKKDSKWSSFRKALRSAWEKEAISRLEGRLVAHRNEIATQLTAMLTDQNSTIVSTLNAMVDENKRRSIQRTEELLELRARINQIGKSKGEVIKSNFDKLQENLADLVRTGQEILTEQNILKSLRFREIRVRFDQIPEAYTETLEWMLQPSRPRAESSGPENRIQFLEWLEVSSHNQPPYWVGGKPGSGKSTLMKFIYEHAKTREALQKWAGSDLLVTASFFFWFYGTKMQKSQEGFLQTLLYEILRKCPNLIQTCVPHRWTNLLQEYWTRSELLEVFGIMKQGLTTSTKFCFFIDGLDEFDGEPRDLLPIIRDLSNTPNVKICVSSRPWQIFKDEFDKHPDQRLYLQDLTRKDIQAYVRSNFENDLNFQHARGEDSGYEELVDEIVERAQGVWLWVALVTKSLLNGFTYGDSLKDLQRRLHYLPVDLEEFFQHMLDSVEPVYQTQMAQTFLVALTAHRFLPLLVYSFLDDIRENPNFALNLSPETSSKHDDTFKSNYLGKIRKREIRMQKRLDARTKGLLEVSSTFVPPPRGRRMRFTHTYRTVDFLHRTVGEFLNKKDINAKFIELAGPNFDSKISLCHGFLAAIKSIPAEPARNTVEISIHELLNYAYISEIETVIAQTEVLDELERFLCSAYPSKTGIKLTQKRQSLKLDRKILINSKSHSILELCVQHGLSIYVNHRLEQDPSLVSSRQWHQPLLSHAFFPADEFDTFVRSIDPTTMVRVLLEHGADPNAVDGDSTTWCKFLLLSTGADPSAGSALLDTLTIVSTSPAKVYQMSMCDKLFDAGANPNAKYDDSTVWKRYLRHLLHGKSGLRNRNILHNEFKLMKLLLLSGADPNATANGKTLDLIIEETLGAYQTTELLDLVRQMRLRTDGGLLSRIWKMTWRRPTQATSCENDRAASIDLYDA